MSKESYEDGYLTINIPRHIRNSGQGSINAKISIVAYYVELQ